MGGRRREKLGWSLHRPFVRQSSPAGPPSLVFFAFARPPAQESWRQFRFLCFRLLARHPRCCHHFGRGQNFRLLSMLLFFLKFLTQVVYISHRFLVFGLILLQFHPSSVCILQLSSVQDCKLKANIGRASFPVSVQSTQPNSGKTDNKCSSAT